MGRRADGRTGRRADGPTGGRVLGVAGRLGGRYFERDCGGKAIQGRTRGRGAEKEWEKWDEWEREQPQGLKRGMFSISQCPGEFTT